MSVAMGRVGGSRRGLVEERLDTFFRAGRSRAARYGPEFERLWELTGQTAQGGKLVRPLLLLDLCTALGRSTASTEAVADLATGLELLHYSFLLHDDVIDGDLVRRGRPNLIGALAEDAPSGATSRALHCARCAAILMGDLLLAACHQRFARADLPGDQRLRLLDLLDDAVTVSAAGEFADVALSDGIMAPELASVLAMTYHKTAAYTFELPLQMASVLNCAPSSTQERLGAIGRHLGQGFQLQDDLLCAFGDSARHGKDALSDLREGKQTALIAFSRQTGTWAQIEPLLMSEHPAPADARRIAELLAGCGAGDFVAGLIRDELTSARALVHGGQDDLPAAARLMLLRLIADMEGRSS